MCSITRARAPAPGLCAAEAGGAGAAGAAATSSQQSMQHAWPNPKQITPRGTCCPRCERTLFENVNKLEAPLAKPDCSSVADRFCPCRRQVRQVAEKGCVARAHAYPGEVRGASGQVRLRVKWQVACAGVCCLEVLCLSVNVKKT